MNKKIIQTQSSTLALCIFVLWSMGVLLIPYLRSTQSIQAAPASLLSLAFVTYLALHVVVFFYTAYLLISQLRGIQRNRKPRSGIYWPVALYLYVLFALIVSILFNTGILSWPVGV